MTNQANLEWKNHAKQTVGREGEKENYLKVLRGEQPEWVPLYRDACDWVFAGYIMEYVNQEKKVDMFNVEWEVDEYGKMPSPSRALLTDIKKWKEFVKFPDISNMDWEAMAAIDLKDHNPAKAVAYRVDGCGGTLFIPLMNMMGFGEGLCALVEEPEAVAELFDAVTTMTVHTMRNVIPYYKPDVVILNDDMATASSPFVSMELFDKLFRPFYQRMIDVAKEFQIPVEFHICGKAEVIVHRLVEMGVSIWQPAQISNDLIGMKAKYGNRLIFNGGWDSQGSAGSYGATEEVVRQSAREAIDTLAKGGGYVFWDLDPVGNSEDMKQKIHWLEDEARRYGSQFY